MLEQTSRNTDQTCLTDSTTSEVTPHHPSPQHCQETQELCYRIAPSQLLCQSERTQQMN